MPQGIRCVAVDRTSVPNFTLISATYMYIAPAGPKTVKIDHLSKTNLNTGVYLQSILTAIEDCDLQ